MNQLLDSANGSSSIAFPVSSRNGSANLPQATWQPPPQTPTQPAIDTSVAAQLRRIEDRKRAQESYKRQHDALQNSIEFYEKMARQFRGNLRESYENSADSCKKQLQELNNRNLGM